MLQISRRYLYRATAGRLTAGMPVPAALDWLKNVAGFYDFDQHVSVTRY